MAFILLFGLWHTLLHDEDSNWETAKCFRFNFDSMHWTARLWCLGVIAPLFLATFMTIFLLAIPVILDFDKHDPLPHTLAIPISFLPACSVFCIPYIIRYFHKNENHQRVSATTICVGVILIAPMPVAWLFQYWAGQRYWIEASALSSAHAVIISLLSLILRYANFREIFDHKVQNEQAPDSRIAFPPFEVAAATALYFVIFLLVGIWIQTNLQTAVLWGTRTVNVQSGVSLLTPFLCLFGAFYTTSFFRLRRIAFRGAKCDLMPPADWSDNSVTMSDLQKVRAIDKTLDEPFRELWSALSHVICLVVLLATFWLIYLWRWSMPLIDGPLWSMSFGMALIAALLFWLYQFISTVFMFHRCREWLRLLDGLPFLEAFEQKRLPQAVSRYMRRLIPVPVPHEQIKQELDVLRRLAQEIGREWLAQAQTAEDFIWGDRLVELANQAADVNQPRYRTLDRVYVELRQRLDGFLDRRIEDRFPELSHNAEDKPSVPEKSRERLCNHMKQYCAIYIVFQLTQRLGYLRDQMLATMISGLLLLIAASSYPFQPASLLRMTAIAMVLAVALLTTFVVVRLERDAVISRVANSTPDAISFDSRFFASAAMWLIPTAILLVGQLVPGSGTWLYQVFEPFLHMKR